MPEPRPTAPAQRDLGPLAWLLDEVRHALDEAVAAVQQFVADSETARATDLSEVDATGLRMARQQLHQATGALDMIELVAPATVLRVLEAVLQRLIQKPALATPDAAASVALGARALVEHLQRCLRQRALPDLALFPTYRAWQRLAGETRVHPADLWSSPEPVETVPPPGKAYAPGPAVRAHLDRLVLQVVREFSPQAAAPLAQLAAGLCRGAEEPALRRFWLAAAGCFEAVAHGRLPESVYVKRAASSVLLQYTHLTQGDLQGLPALTRDLLFLASQAEPLHVVVGAPDPTPVLRSLWAAHGWQPSGVWDWERELLGAVDPAAQAAVREALAAAQAAWALLGEGESPTQAVGPLQRLAAGLQALWPDCAPLAEAWQAVAQACASQPGPAPWPVGLSLEVSNSLLFLAAVLDEFDPIDTAQAPRWAALAQRLHRALAGEAVPTAEPWMTEVYRRLNERQTLGQLATQLRAELAGVEAALDGLFRHTATASSGHVGAPDALRGLEPVPAQFDAMLGVVRLLQLDAAEATLADAHGTVAGWWTLPAAELPAAVAAQAPRLGANLGALGWLFDTLARQPDLARDAFVFDPVGRQLESRLVTPVAEPPQALDVPPAVTQAPGPEAVVYEQVALPAREVQPVDATPQTAGEDDGAELLAIFLEEAAGVLQQAQEALAVLRQQPDSLPDLTALRRGFHTLKGSARMVGLADVGEAAWAQEQLLNAWLADRQPASVALLDQSGQVLDHLARWVDGLSAGQPEAKAGQSAPVRASADALRLRGEFVPVAAVPLLDEAVKVIGPLCIDLELYNVFLNEADEWSRRLGQGLSEWALTPAEAIPSELSALAHSLAGGAGTVGYTGLSRLAKALEHALDRVLARPAGVMAVAAADADVLVGAAEEARNLLHQFAAGFLKEPAESTLESLAAVASQPAATAAPASADELPAPAATDTLDSDLFAVFEDEAQELLPRLGAALRQWVARPDNTGARAEVLRNLHTFKGSARLAGALRLGELAHRLESDVLALPEQPASVDAVRPLQNQLDALVARFDALRAVYTSAPAGSRAAQPVEGVRVLPPEGLRLPEPPLRAEGAAGPGPTLRVRADLLDRIMVQTGDVMITRSRLDTDLRGLRQSFKDMSANIERLRHQLRDLELQTETQMQSRLAQSREADARFDPLEFDRFTRVQELTRLLAESVNDVATVQHQLQRAVDSAEGNLAAQARQTRELQRDLLRTRLVAFDSLAERLHRVVRQAAEASGKQAELQLHGAEVEVDRGVLDRLAPVLEHLLRNAVVHGLESPAARQAAGKPVGGAIGIALEPHGNDLTLTLYDDGAGLDLARIRERAIAQGVLAPDAPFDEADAVRCIFAPGVSTAADVTEVAGRGIGLDVVRTEVLGLGGRIEYLRPEGGGTGFRLVVPLSTAVTQVVMLRVGDFTFGVPAPWVEAVRRAHAPELTAAYVSGQWREGAELMPFYWAGALLALSTESTDPQAHAARSWPVLEFYSAGQRVAWHVDEVLGHQEVVVKPLGPQLARLPGLAGATVLASGAVALIYNPVALASLYGEAARAWVRSQRAQGVQGAVPAPQAAASGGPQAPLVLVVDDSITVRRVTQRLLKREGYRVALAADGLQALERLREELPVVVLCDIEMPRMDGFEFVRHLRDEPAWATLPVVMITSRLADKHRDHARAMGVDHYLGKPYPEEELLALVEAYARLAPPLEPPRP